MLPSIYIWNIFYCYNVFTISHKVQHSLPNRYINLKILFADIQTSLEKIIMIIQVDSTGCIPLVTHLGVYTTLSHFQTTVFSQPFVVLCKPGGKTRTKDKYRVVYTDKQRLELEKEFQYNHYITMRRKSELSAALALSERQVRQNDSERWGADVTRNWYPQDLEENT